MIETALSGPLSALTAFRQFLCYIIIPSKTREGKKDKLPISPATGAVVDAHDSQHWVDAKTAAAAAKQFGAGVAFVFTKEAGFFFVDIDGAYDGQQWSQTARQLLAAFPGAAVEVSQSNTGLHIIGRANTDVAVPHSTRNQALGLEFYTEKRFVALTGTSAQGDASTDHTAALAWLTENYFPATGALRAESFDLSTAPDPEWNGPTDDADLIRRALASRSAANTFGTKASFADLWECNTERLRVAFPDPSRLYDESAADAALISHLSFWTGRHGERIERLMRQSKLVRPKWDREDYLPRTIANVLARGGDVLKDKQPEPPPSPAASPEAPIQRKVEGSTFLSPDQQREVFKGCVYVQGAHRVLVPGGQLLKPDQFRASYGGYVFAMDEANQKTSRSAWEAFTESQCLRAPIVDATCFRPELAPAVVIKMAGRAYANAWWPAEVPRQVGDVSPFLDLMQRMLPDERDRMILLSYMAACVQYKGVKFGWWPVIQGAEGNGKSTLAVCLKEALGRHYTHWIDAVSVKTEFNAFLANRLLIVIEELRASEHQDEIIKKLYTIITGGEGIQIQQKGVDQFSTEICCNGMCMTNFQDSMRKTANNARRFGLFFTAQQTAADVERDMPGDYFPKFYDWLRTGGGYGIVSELLHTFPIPNEFNPATTLHRAPRTSSTDAAIQASLGSVEQHIAEAVAEGLPGFMNGWVSTAAVEKLLEGLGMANRVSLAKRREMLVAMGYALHPGLHDGRPNNPVQPDGRKPQLFVKRGSPLEYMRGAAEIAKKYSQDQQISLARH